jgi:hypothetical protein
VINFVKESNIIAGGGFVYLISHPRETNILSGITIPAKLRALHFRLSQYSPDMRFSTSALLALPLLAAAAESPFEQYKAQFQNVLGSLGVKPAVAAKEAVKGKKRVLISYGVDVDAVAGWLGSYGGEDSANDISRGKRLFRYTPAEF